MAYIFLCVILAFFIGSRENTGYDYFSYEELFKQIQGYNSFTQLIHSRMLFNFEPGYVLLNFAFKYSNFRVFLFFCASLSLVPKCAYFYCRTKHSFVALLYAYCSIFLMYDMGVIRQAIAMGICLWAMDAYAHRKMKAYFILLLVACAFHVSSLSLLLLLLTGRIKHSYIFYLLILFAGGVVAILHPLKLVSGNYATDANGYVTIASKIIYYATAYLETATWKTIAKSIIKRLIVFVLVYNISIHTDDLAREKYQLIWTNINAFFLSIVLSIFLTDIPIIAGRGTAMLQSSQVILLSNCMDLNYKRTKGIYDDGNGTSNIILFIIIVIFSFLNFKGLMSEADYLQYHSFLLNNTK